MGTDHRPRHHIRTKQVKLTRQHSPSVHTEHEDFKETDRWDLEKGTSLRFKYRLQHPSQLIKLAKQEKIKISLLLMNMS